MTGPDGASGAVRRALRAGRGGRSATGSVATLTAAGLIARRVLFGQVRPVPCERWAALAGATPSLTGLQAVLDGLAGPERIGPRTGPAGGAGGAGRGGTGSGPALAARLLPGTGAVSGTVSGAVDGGRPAPGATRWSHARAAGGGGDDAGGGPGATAPFPAAPIAGAPFPAAPSRCTSAVDAPSPATGNGHPAPDAMIASGTRAVVAPVGTTLPAGGRPSADDLLAVATPLGGRASGRSPGPHPCAAGPVGAVGVDRAAPRWPSGDGGGDAHPGSRTGPDRGADDPVGEPGAGHMAEPVDRWHGRPGTLGDDVTRDRRARDPGRPSRSEPVAAWAGTDPSALVDDLSDVLDELLRREAERHGLAGPG